MSPRLRVLLLVAAVAGSFLEAFDLNRDPKERRNLGSDDVEMLDKAKRQLEAFLALVAKRNEGGPPSLPVELDPAERERLRALGYVR